MGVGERPVEVLAVGDVMLGRGVQAAGASLEEVAPVLQAADLTLGNLECALTLQEEQPVTPEGPGEKPDRPYRLVAPASAAEELAFAGFDLLGLANNHALDRGLGGLVESAQILEEAGIGAFGAAPSREEAYRAVVREVRGLKLAFLAINAVSIPRGEEWSGEVRQIPDVQAWALAGWEREAALEAVEAASRQADVVVVSIHWGYEYTRRVDPLQREMAKALAEAGVDLIVGHHPHVIQGMETLAWGKGDPMRESVAAYSLGNFVFDQGFGDTGQGLALRALFDQEGLRAIQALPVQAGPRPVWLSPGAGEEALQRAGLLKETPTESRSLGPLAWRCDAEKCSPLAANQLPEREHQPSSPQAAVTSDLTGDGVPERAVLEGGQVRVEGRGLPAWESAAEWEALDMAAGDPNGDGRQELLLALRKRDRSGVVLSHPYILGVRGGQLRLVWGGSAVNDPILEVELGDLDGDGRQELAVLEELQSGKGRAVSLWRWNGWGFTRLWRSPAGRYFDLHLVRLDSGEWALSVMQEQIEE